MHIVLISKIFCLNFPEFFFLLIFQIERSIFSISPFRLCFISLDRFSFKMVTCLSNHRFRLDTRKKRLWSENETKKPNQKYKNSTFHHLHLKVWFFPEREAKNRQLIQIIQQNRKWKPLVSLSLVSSSLLYE